MSEDNRRERTSRIIGFTLLEMLVILVIVSLIVVMAVPSYRHYSRINHEQNLKALLQNYAIQLEQWRAKSLTYAGFTPQGLRQNTHLPLQGDLEADNMTINYPANSTGNDVIYSITITAPIGGDGTQFIPIRTSPIANQWLLLAIPKQPNQGLASIGMTSNGLKCQNKNILLSQNDIWNNHCGTGSMAW